MRAVPFRLTCLALLLLAAPFVNAGDTRPYSKEECPPCAGWNEPQEPFRVHGDTYYVGTRGLTALLVASEAGHVLIDGGLPDSAPMIAANIRALGFRVEDVKWILNSHAHYDHAGGIAALRRMSGARVAATRSSADVLMRGTPGRDDPQHDIALPFPRVGKVEVIRDGATIRAGKLRLTAHLTPGHTPGGTTWTWRSCEEGRCADIVYADSMTAVSADGFRFSGSAAYPTALRDFERSFARIESLPCDILLTPHPGASQLWERREKGTLAGGDACRRYAASAREQLARRVAREKGESGQR